MKGVRKDDIKLSHKNSTTLTITASRECPKEFSDYFNVLERPCGDMSRTIYFPRLIREETTKARLDEGVLTVTTEKESKHSLRTIPINIE